MALRTIFLGVGLVTALLSSAAGDEPVDAKRDDGFMPIFNGKDLTGWEGSPGWWEVRDGLLVAESTPARPCRRSHYLYWKGGEPADFELRATCRISGEANSGIQFRSQPRPDWDVWGYQADLDSAGQYTGCLYQHERGLVAERGQRVRIDTAGNKEVAAIEDADELLRQVQPRNWIEYRIRADGPTVTLWINDIWMCEIEDHEQRFALPRGVIALQMHQGPPMKVEFKDIRIRVLNAPSPDDKGS